MRGFAGFFTSPVQVPDAANFARSGDGRVAVAFDGTIHNRAELAGFSPFTDDAQLILALYLQHGRACVGLLRGPFALAVWDARDGVGTGLLARDPMGLRSLYHFHDAEMGRLSFATGVKALMAADGAVPRQLDARGLYGFFRHGAVPEPFSMVAGVRALETGATLLWRAGQFTLERPPRPTPVPFPPDDRETKKALRAVLLDSVDRHLADHPAAGMFVGGGMGSAALLALAREAGREKKLRALTIGFDDAASDETELARRTAAHFGVPHTHLRLDRERARAWFDDYLPALDQPGVHGFPMFALCRFAREEGITVALAGVGLSELFGDPELQVQLKRMVGQTRRAWRFKTPPMLADFLSRPPTLPGAYAAVRGVHTAEEARAMVARFTDPTGCADLLPEELPAAPDEAINALEYQRGLRDQLLRQAEVFGRAQGLEMRLPFVDARVRETIARIPAAGRAHTQRLLLKEAVSDLPPWIPIKPAPPCGLRFPIDQWQAEEWGTSKPTDAIGTRQRMRRTWEQKWSLFLFRRWWRQFAAG